MTELARIKHIFTYDHCKDLYLRNNVSKRIKARHSVVYENMVRQLGLKSRSPAFKVDTITAALH